ncbi:hypothetical protein [Qipengyuania oceanensis]|uniref:PRC-barrel domain-containing protein n=1 Tax=Qipengyuania oceanensis TaxID=1463597 RepID=A0A844YKQ5_9SPHN|nr:hypothetical protein [Qipengyuania oceanensis]MXO64085.1 hypothetical protein [Qipengyuania oceanensis]
MKKLLFAASALTFFVAPAAQAQLLPGSPVGSIARGSTGPIGSITRLPRESVRSATRGEVRGDANTRGSQNVDRRSGSVSLDRTIDAGADATASQLLDTPLGSANGSTSGSGRASGSGSADAQLIGTEAVQGVAQDTVGRGREMAATVRNLVIPAVGATRDRATDPVGQASTLAGSAQGAGSAAGAASGMLGNGVLAVAGSGAAEGEGAFAVAPRIPVMSPSGDRLGEVRQIIADKRGRIQQVVVETRDRTVTLPAASLAGSGGALVMVESSAAGELPAE